MAVLKKVKPFWLHFLLLLQPKQNYSKPPLANGRMVSLIAVLLAFATRACGAPSFAVESLWLRSWLVCSWPGWESPATVSQQRILSKWLSFSWSPTLSIPLRWKLLLRTIRRKTFLLWLQFSRPLEVVFFSFGVSTVSAEPAKTFERSIPSLRSDVLDARIFAVPFCALVAQFRKWLVTLENTKRTLACAAALPATLRALRWLCR
jgi:hypothetical protein